MVLRGPGVPGRVPVALGVGRWVMTRVGAGVAMRAETIWGLVDGGHLHRVNAPGGVVSCAAFLLAGIQGRRLSCKAYPTRGVSGRGITCPRGAKVHGRLPYSVNGRESSESVPCARVAPRASGRDRCDQSRTPCHVARRVLVRM